MLFLSSSSFSSVGGIISENGSTEVIYSVHSFYVSLPIKPFGNPDWRNGVQQWKTGRHRLIFVNELRYYYNPP
jgi:hypothetical protein